MYVHAAILWNTTFCYYINGTQLYTHRNDMLKCAYILSDVSYTSLLRNAAVSMMYM